MNEDKPSATALLIAKSQLLMNKTLVSSEKSIYYQAFVEAAENKLWHPSLFYKYWHRIIEYLSIPGIYLHYALRKLCIEKTVRKLLTENKAQQVVVIAAGFDPLLAMLSKQYKDVSFFELDHPATQQIKEKALLKLTQPKNLSLLPVDLTKQSILDILSNSTFSSDKTTLFIAEGITMYLTKKEIELFFQQIKSAASNPENSLIFTYMNKQQSGSINFESASIFVCYWLWIKKETFKWGVRTDELSFFLSKIGYNLVDIFDDEYLRKEYLSDNKSLPLAKGENICLAKIKC
jgi:methyltransferase (TIGR00027 family)